MLTCHDSSVSGGSKSVVNFYNGRGTAEHWIKEGKHAIRWTRLSCHGFDANQARLQLHVLAYNLGNFLRRLALPPSVKQWSLTTLRDKLIKIGAKVVHQFITPVTSRFNWPKSRCRAGSTRRSLSGYDGSPRCRRGQRRYDRCERLTNPTHD